MHTAKLTVGMKLFYMFPDFQAHGFLTSSQKACQQIEATVIDSTAVYCEGAALIGKWQPGCIQAP